MCESQGVSYYFGRDEWLSISFTCQILKKKVCCVMFKGAIRSMGCWHFLVRDDVVEWVGGVRRRHHCRIEPRMPGSWLKTAVRLCRIEEEEKEGRPVCMR